MFFKKFLYLFLFLVTTLVMSSCYQKSARGHTNLITKNHPVEKYKSKQDHCEQSKMTHKNNHKEVKATTKKPIVSSEKGKGSDPLSEHQGQITPNKNGVPIEIPNHFPLKENENFPKPDKDQLKQKTQDDENKHCNH